MHNQVGLDLDGFPLDHEFSEDYGQEGEDECDIEVEPLFGEELANQAVGARPMHTRQPRTSFFFHERKKFPPYQISVKARALSDIGMQDMAFQALKAFKVQHNGKSFNLSHCFRVIKDEEKFKAQYATLKSRGRKQAMEEVGDGEKARPRGKTNSKKEDKWDAASNALIGSVEGMMRKKDSREEERRRYKEEQMNAFMKIQRRRLEMKAEKQAKMPEMEAEKQAKMLEIEAANAKTKAKEVALASMMTGVEIMKVDLNTVSPRKRSWFDKMQADMLKFDDDCPIAASAIFFCMPTGVLA
ncbi:hypothetical protein VPH35_130275 [Triticum aestivum]